MGEDGSEHGGHVPPASERVGQRPPASASDGHGQTQERTEHHTLSVKDTARLFEDADVARTERSITRWCQPNPQGQAKLDCYFDTNEIKWLITSQSVTLAIAEEQARRGEGGLITSASVGHRRTTSEKETDSGAENNENITRLADLKEENRQLKADKKGRDQLISSLQDTLMRQSEIFGRQIAEVADQKGEWKAKFEIADQQLKQLNPGPVEGKKEEQEKPAGVLHTEPAPVAASVNSPETPPTASVRVVNHDVPTETPAVPEEEEMAGDAPLNA